MALNSFIGEGVAAAADQRPDDLALVWPGGEMTWQTLHAEVQQLAIALDATTSPGARIALDLANGTSVLLLGLAALRAGRIAMLYDPTWPEAVRETVFRQTAPELVVTESGRRNDGAERAEFLWAAPFESGPALSQRLLRARRRRGIRLPRPPAKDQPFYICFSSGSTGVPKGILRSHRSWLASFRVTSALGLVKTGTRKLALGSFGHSTHFYAAMESLHFGSCFGFLERFGARDALALCAAREIDTVVGTPTQVQWLAAARDRLDLPALPGVKTVIAGGSKWPSPTPPAVENCFPSAEIIEFYGASETSYIAIARAGEALPAGAVGYPVPGVELRFETSSDRLADHEEPGKIWVRSDQLFDRYVCGAPTASCVDGWVTVGDHGYLDADGRLCLKGRDARSVSVAGSNVFLDEIEAFLRTQPGVLDAVVAGLPDQVRGSTLAAALRLRDADQHEVHIGALRRQCLAQLGTARTPRQFEVLTTWPLTAGGKTDLLAIEALLLSRQNA